jgi:hypothetical protein
LREEESEEGREGDQYPGRMIRNSYWIMGKAGLNYLIAKEACIPLSVHALLYPTYIIRKHPNVPGVQLVTTADELELRELQQLIQKQQIVVT